MMMKKEKIGRIEFEKDRGRLEMSSLFVILINFEINNEKYAVYMIDLNLLREEQLCH